MHSSKQAMRQSVVVLLMCMLCSVLEVKVGGADYIPPARLDGFVYGNQYHPDSVLIEAFFDPLCPDSRDSWPPLKEAIAHYGCNVSLVVHLLPLPYARYGDVSPKIDVYAFGVVLYELISAKEAIVKINESITDSKGIVSLFDGVLNQPNPTEDLRKLVDPRLGGDYPVDSVFKMAQLAKACTQDNPQLRPSMRSIVVALMTLSSATEEWDFGSFYENSALMNLMSRR